MKTGRIVQSLVCYVAGLSLVGGCSLVPTYERPELPLPEQWGPATAVTPSRSKTLDGAWWLSFDDAALTDLINTALTGNFDLLASTALVEGYYARVGIARSAVLPEIGVAGSFDRGERSGRSVIPGAAGIREEYNLSSSLSWELDLWGRLSGETAAVRNELVAQEANRRGVLVLLVAAVAEGYFELRSLDQQLDIAEHTLETRKGALGIAQSRFDAGVASELELRQAEAEVAGAEVTVPQVREQLRLAELRLCGLLGKAPFAIPRGKGITELAEVAPLVPGIPADVLLDRPDLVAAEAELIAANARVGVARAQFLPRISLTGNLGYASSELDSLIGSGSRLWSVGPAVNIPIFNAGRLRNGVRLRESDKERLVAQYRGAIVAALEEVEGALATFRSVKDQVAARAHQVAVLGRYLDLAQVNYKEGQTSYLAVLDAERRHFDAELGLAQARNNLLKALVRGYRSLGGKWIDVADQQAGPIDQTIPVLP